LAKEGNCEWTNKTKQNKGNKSKRSQISKSKSHRFLFLISIHQPSANFNSLIIISKSSECWDGGSSETAPDDHPMVDGAWINASEWSEVETSSCAAAAAAAAAAATT
jgi:hypothetical protein